MSTIPALSTDSGGLFLLNRRDPYRDSRETPPPSNGQKRVACPGKHEDSGDSVDMVAVHFVSIEPARDWAASTAAAPLSGALTSTHTTATLLQPPLPETVWIWQPDLVQWLVSDYGFSELDTSQFATQAVESPPANVCDTDYTGVAKIRREWLPERETRRGPHARIRETAAALGR
ncbi:hypothetical protein AB0D14_35045 [Streptomyces sp. NPDC048484]|uniref:hypothetical protein n=1 Tax=Streptomyces sp. NPDC048484 TaxID=3155146 RepID=UPI0034488B7A